MEIVGIIEGIKYVPLLKKSLKIKNIEEFDINQESGSSIVKVNDTSFAVSKWVSPKRTRSYPYERVYDTFLYKSKITIIPVIKDEGLDGDRDFLQWDTVSLMNLLDVYIVFAYYTRAKKHLKYKNKITNQEFDNEYIKNKIIEISQYHSSALHWNTKELNQLNQIVNGLS
jgi:hypothetical protein